MKRIFLSLVVASYLVAGISAQEYGFDVWTTANGLPQNTVTGIVQTPDGYLWLATFDGLARFDGVRFMIFDKGNTRGIANNRFGGVFADRDGAVWAWTENGGLTVYRAGVFNSYAAPEGLRENIAGVRTDAAGNALIETRERFYYLQDGKFVFAPEQKETGVRLIFYGKRGAKWILEANQITKQKDGRTIVYPFKFDSVELSSTYSVVLFEDKTEALWLRTLDRRIACFRSDGTVKIYSTQEIPALKELNSNDFFEDSEGAVYSILSDSLVSKQSKLIRFKDENLTVFDLPEAINPTASIIDREGNFWLSTPTGLRRLRQQIVTNLSVKNKLNSNEVYPILQARNGDFYIGSTRGVNRFDASGVMTDLKLKYAAHNFALYMRGLWEDADGRIWLGYNGGFGRLENNSLKELNTNPIPSGATDFTSDRDGNVWIAAGDGIYKFKDDKEIAHYTTADGLPQNEVVCVRFDRSGNLWAGTFNGLAEFKDGRFIDFIQIENSPQGFVRAIYEDADGTLWFGTYSDGLVRYKDGKFFNYRVEDGLFNNGAFAILEDNRDNLWMSSNRGIYRVGKQELNDFADGKISKLTSVSYDEKDGMLNVECNGGRLPAAVKTKDGKLWFATMGGIAVVDPEAEKTNPNPPPVVIETVSIDRKAIALDTLQSAIGNPNSAIEASAGQSNLEIQYTGLSLIKSDQIKFKYKLEGLEENWVEAGTERAANYSYLPHGEYTFRVIAANANGVWNTEGAAIRIIVQPYFYQTWWFRVLASFAVALLIGLIYHNRVSHLRQIARAKTLFSRQLIESQEQERKRLAAELHDGLGQNLVVIKNRAMLGINKGDDKERVARELGSISESATLALEEVREITNNLRPQLLDRLGLTKAINAMLKKVSGVIEIESEIDSIDEVFSEIEEINVYRIVQESLNNIIKHSHASDARVKITRDENKVLIQIEDNGKGFDVGNTKSNGGGFGLVGIRERTQLLGGDLAIDSTIGEGTKIQIVIEGNL